MSTYARITAFLAALALPLLLAFGGEKYSTKIVRVIDGDKLLIEIEGWQERVRLQGIDCPELRQPYGWKARQTAKSLIQGRTVMMERHGRDRYGRTFTGITLPDGRNLGRELVRSGACWWYKRYDPKNETLQRLEAEARKEKRGLWTNPNPVPPWEWRKRRRQLQ